MGDDTLRQQALAYHSFNKPGKIEVVSTKPLATQHDLSLGYTPGVAEVCKAIAEDAEAANLYTSKGNLVAVITNGSAVLGLGNIGPLAAKPVMEGKAVLFKKFANIDVFDLEIAESDPDIFVEMVTRLAPSFGGINLEDIKAPECFYIEEKLRENIDIPVLHDDQHGTAIIVCAAFINALKLTKRSKESIKITCSGAGAAGLACMRLLVDYGVPRKNITLVDIDGVVYQGRANMNPHLQEFAQDTEKRTLTEALEGADMLFGLSAGGIVTADMVSKMADQPIIFAMANPTPEIMPDEVKKVKPDALIGTGRSDFPNQINNVLGFPYLFRGALDCGAKTFNTEMKLAAADALATLARKTADAALKTAYKSDKLKFGPEYLIPKPFDPRLLAIIAPAVAKAAMDTGVATRPIKDLKAYAAQLQGTVDKSFSIMRQIVSTARKSPQRIVYPEGEDERVLQAAQELINDNIVHPIILGRRNVVVPLIEELGLTMREGEDFTFFDPQTDVRLELFSKQYYDMRKRHGVTAVEAAVHMRSRWMAFACMLLHNGEADGIVAGVSGRFQRYFSVTKELMVPDEGARDIFALTLVMHKDRLFFIGDTHINYDPSAEQICRMAELAAAEVKHFDIEPRIALVSHSNFGSSDAPSAVKMRQAYKLIKEKMPNVIVEGEMQADAALDDEVRNRVFPDAMLLKRANVLLMPNIDAANITFNVLRTVQADAEYIGPLLLGMEQPIHILSGYAPVRRIVNVSALAGVEAQGQVKK